MHVTHPGLVQKHSHITVTHNTLTHSTPLTPFSLICTMPLYAVRGTPALLSLMMPTMRANCRNGVG